MPFAPAIQPPATATPQAWCFAFVGNLLLLPDDDGPGLQAVLPETLAVHAASRHYLGTLSGHDCWAMLLPAAPTGWVGTPLRAAMLRFEPALAALAGRAAQVLEWDRSHRFCGVCGTPTLLQPGERARVCPACKQTSYPRLSPSMMALVWRPGELLLARSPHFARGMYSALAGFVEAGESLEDCVHREVAEEVGLRVQGLRYFGSQSWPFPHSLMVAYTAQYAGGEIVPQPGEIEDAQWFPIDALPGIPPRFSIAGHLIRDTLALMQAGATP
jgi:NAD+ diphosphatase